MKFKIDSIEARSKVTKAVSEIQGKPMMQVEIKEYKEDRSAEQNAYLWGVVYPTIRNFVLESTGENHTCEAIHEWCKDEFINAEPKKVMGKLILIKSTKGGKKKFSEYLERVFHHFAEIGCVIPDPEPTIVEKVQSEFPNARVEE